MDNSDMVTLPQGTVVPTLSPFGSLVESDGSAFTLSGQFKHASSTDVRHRASETVDGLHPTSRAAASYLPRYKHSTTGTVGDGPTSGDRDYDYNAVLCLASPLPFPTLTARRQAEVRNATGDSYFMFLQCGDRVTADRVVTADNGDGDVRKWVGHVAAPRVILHGGVGFAVATTTADGTPPAEKATGFSL